MVFDCIVAPALEVVANEGPLVTVSRMNLQQPLLFLLTPVLLAVGFAESVEPPLATLLAGSYRLLSIHGQLFSNLFPLASSQPGNKGLKAGILARGPLVVAEAHCYYYTSGKDTIEFPTDFIRLLLKPEINPLFLKRTALKIAKITEIKGGSRV